MNPLGSESEEHVREMLATLPFARAELIEVASVPLKPYAGFSSEQVPVRLLSRGGVPVS